MIQRALLFLLVVATVDLSARTGDLFAKEFRAGTSTIDVTPTSLPVIQNGYFTQQLAAKVNDRLFARSLVLDDGETRLVVCVVDTCMMPRELLDKAKLLARETTGIPTDRMLISATHTHRRQPRWGAWEPASTSHTPPGCRAESRTASPKPPKTSHRPASAGPSPTIGSTPTAAVGSPGPTGCWLILSA